MVSWYRSVRRALVEGFMRRAPPDGSAGLPDWSSPARHCGRRPDGRWRPWCRPSADTRRIPAPAHPWRCSGRNSRSPTRRRTTAARRSPGDGDGAGCVETPNRPLRRHRSLCKWSRRTWEPRTPAAAMSRTSLRRSEPARGLPGCETNNDRGGASRAWEKSGALSNGTGEYRSAVRGWSGRLRRCPALPRGENRSECRQWSAHRGAWGIPSVLCASNRKKLKTVSRSTWLEARGTRQKELPPLFQKPLASSRSPSASCLAGCVNVLAERATGYRPPRPAFLRP